MSKRLQFLLSINLLIVSSISLYTMIPQGDGMPTGGKRVTGFPAGNSRQKACGKKTFPATGTIATIRLKDAIDKLLRAHIPLACQSLNGVSNGVLVNTVKIDELYTDRNPGTKPYFIITIDLIIQLRTVTGDDKHTDLNNLEEQSSNAIYSLVQEKIESAIAAVINLPENTELYNEVEFIFSITFR